MKHELKSGTAVNLPNAIFSIERTPTDAAASSKL